MSRQVGTGLGTQLRHLLELLDGDLDRLYQEDIPGFRARYAPVVRVLGEQDGRTIRDIAREAGITHSAVSQTVAQMVAIGLVSSSVGADARERVIGFTDKGRALLPYLARRRQVSQALEQSFEDELGAPLRAYLSALIHSLEAKPFYERQREGELELNAEL